MLRADESPSAGCGGVQPVFDLADPADGAHHTITLISGKDVNPQDAVDDQIVQGGGSDVYVVGKYTSYGLIEGTKWISPILGSGATSSYPDGTTYPFAATTTAGTTTFTQTFTLPDNFTLPLLNISVLTDNGALIYLNDEPVGEHGYIEDGDPLTPAAFQTAGDFNDDSQFHAGENVLRVDLINGPGTGCNYLAALDYLATVYYGLVPVVNSVTGPTDPVAVNSAVNVCVDYTPGDPNNTVAFDWAFGSATSQPETDVDLDAPSCTTHTYTEPGIYWVEATITDTDGDSDNGTTGVPIVVYDPSAGFVTGGGWINSPDCAYMPDICGGTGETFFSDPFDSDPVLADAQAAGAWYTDRYAPAGFESAPFDGDNRLKVHIAAADYLPNSSTFYNYQGRKYDLGNNINTYITADLYIGSDWQNHNRHASLRATTSTQTGTSPGIRLLDSPHSMRTGTPRGSGSTPRTWIRVPATAISPGGTTSDSPRDSNTALGIRSGPS